VTDDEIPLDITGHEQRDRPSTESGSGADSESDLLAGKSTVDGDDSAGINDEEDEDDEPGAGNDGDGSDESGDEDDVEDEDGEVEPVEVLVQLAEEGAIDPWDIDIVEVTDEFLARLDEADLRTSGRALFYASVLLRMKSDAMLADDEDEPEEPEPWEQVGGEEPLGEPDPFATLEHEMDRRLERKRARGTPQTLDELVRDLREAERDTWWKESREYDTSGSSDEYRRGTQELDYRSADEFRMDDEPTEAEVTGNTHGEDISAIVDDVHAAVREHYDQGRKEVLFREVESAGDSRVLTYLGLLFLSHRGQVRLRQDELFGDLWIQDPAAIAGSGEAVAD
jgi:segregation and condensation protein A